ncbi:hypothetical protein JVW19_23370, partial [Vibrio cholerae O1]|nr:hypothetical protein [Vibrio cholerae O1]
GADLDRVYRAGTLTRILNGHPDEAAAPAVTLGSRVAIVGQGNVAVDIVRLLTSQDETLEGSDLDDRVYRPLRADIS